MLAALNLARQIIGFAPLVLDAFKALVNLVKGRDVEAQRRIIDAALAAAEDAAIRENWKNRPRA